MEAIENIFFVGLQEAYDITVEMLLRELNVTLTTKILKERDQSNPQIAKQKAALKANHTIMNRYKELNKIDYDLYHLGIILIVISSLLLIIIIIIIILFIHLIIHLTIYLFIYYLFSPIY